MSRKSLEAGSREYRDPASIILDLASATERGRRKRLRELVASHPREEVVPLLALELSECTDGKRFERVANTLARVGGSEAFEALAHHARTQRRFPGLAIHALSRCDDERTIPMVIDLAEFGRKTQRVSAIRALGRMNEITSIEMLCRLASAKNREQIVGHAAWQALKRKGGYDGLSYSVLGDQELGLPAKLTIFLALEGAPHLSWRGFNASRALEKAHRAPLHPFRSEARSVLNLMRARASLLRPSTGVSDENLLRAAGSSATDSTSLLRGSESSSCPHTTGIPGIARIMVERIKRVFQRL